MSFRACRVFSENGQVHHRLVSMQEDELSAGDVDIAVEYSSVNYKDALAASGRGKILKAFPLNAGIDLAGKVIASRNAEVAVGTQVLVNGCGLGEHHDGGLAQRARVPAGWLVPLPAGLSALDAMTLGTAGFTAALCLHRMVQNGQTPAQGPVVVTGASGGVGSVAVALLAAQGYEVIAVSGREAEHARLRALGAQQVCSVADLNLGSKPLEAGRFGGVIDNVGGAGLAALIAHVQLWGNVACVGLADSPQLATTVFPLILRGVSLLGISSANCPMPLRRALWQKLGAEWALPEPSRLRSDIVPLSAVSPVFNDLLDRKRSGRTVVDCNR